MATHRVGGEIDATCTRCRMELAHTILAMVGTKVARVRCNTCGSDHVYRGTQSSSRSAASRTRAATAEKTPKTVIAFEAQLAALDVSKAEEYRADHTYAVDQVVRHPTFGLGIVRAVRQDKMDVAFKAAERTLVQGRSTGAARPSFNPPHRPEDAPEASDAGEER
jgi:Fe2+ transport system protein B